MASTFYKEIAELTDQELVSKANDLRRRLFEAKIQKATARLERNAVLKQLRRDIARCETRLSALAAKPAKS